jgi:hypothetical protein
MKLLSKRIILIALLFFMNCVTSDTATKFNNLSTPVGKPKTYLSVTTIGLNFLIVVPWIRKAEFSESIEEFSKHAKEMKATKINIIQKETTKWALLLPPFTFVLTPVVTEITGEVYE